MRGKSLESEVVVVGGSGFIGSRTALALAKTGREVRTIDLVPPPPDIASLVSHQVLDISDAKALSGAFASTSLVIHCAANLLRRCREDPKRSWQTNVCGTLNILRELISQPAAPRLIFLSTGGVYDHGAAHYPLTEQSPVAGNDLYTASKLAGEAMISATAQASGLTAITLRLFTVYGEGPAAGWKGHFIAGWIEKILEGRPLSIFGSGQQTVDATHVDDVVRAILLASQAALARGENPVFNIGSGKETAVQDIARWMKAVEPSISVAYEHSPHPSPPRQLADYSKARSILDYVPRIAPETGIQNLLRHSLATRAMEC